MVRPLLPLLTLAASVAAAPCTAQTLASRPALFRDPVLATDPSYGELVLGRTTLTAALRIFALELQDSVRMPMADSSKPDTLWARTESPGAPVPRPNYRLDIGSGRYTLYFDKHERLVGALTHGSRLPRPLRREELVARYPTLKVDQIGRTVEGVWIRDELLAPLGPCVTLIADVWRRDKGLVGTFGYLYTCPTKPAHSPARR
jgi:hypothetical protein